MSPKISSFKRAGRNGKRYRKQINNRVYEKYFCGNKEQREYAYKLWVAELEKENKSRQYDGSKTWAFFAGAFIKYMRNEKDKKTGKPVWRARTIKEYQYALDHFRAAVKPHFAKDITFEDVAAFRRVKVDEAQKAGDDNYGVNKDMGCILRAFDWGMTEGYIPYIDLTPLRKSPKHTSAPVVKVLTAWELSMLLKYSSPVMKVAVRMGLEGNLRPEEMYNFVVSKIDPKTGIAWVSHNDEDKSAGIREWTVKRDKERPVFFTKPTIKAILALRPKTYILTNKKGKPFDDSTFSKAWAKNLKDVNDLVLRHEDNAPEISCTAKSLRKTHTTYMMRAGAKEEDVSLYVSHADKKTTERHYIDKETLRQAEKQKRLAHMAKMKPYVEKVAKMLSE